jgi:hypothetical protein
VDNHVSLSFAKSTLKQLYKKLPFFNVGI